jgi:hypothetical protein
VPGERRAVRGRPREGASGRFAHFRRNPVKHRCCGRVLVPPPRRVASQARKSRSRGHRIAECAIQLPRWWDRSVRNHRLDQVPPGRYVTPRPVHSGPVGPCRAPRLRTCCPSGRARSADRATIWYHHVRAAQREFSSRSVDRAPRFLLDQIVDAPHVAEAVGRVAWLAAAPAPTGGDRNAQRWPRRYNGRHSRRDSTGP